jgi:hypothetical protein
LRATEADRYRIAYVAAVEARYAIRSPSIAIEGTSSVCCNAATYERLDQSWCCRCSRMCKTRRWRAPKSGAASRGGWAPGIAETELKWIDGRWVEVDTGRSWNRVLIQETRTVRGDGEDERRLMAWRDYEPLEHLFDLPAHAAEPAWLRSLFAWDSFLMPGLREWNPVDAMKVAVERGRSSGSDAALWTLDSARVWIGGARRVVVGRLTAAEEAKHPIAIPQLTHPAAVVRPFRRRVRDFVRDVLAAEG